MRSVRDVRRLCCGTRLRAAAWLLLVVIGIDLAVDAGCDSIGSVASASAVGEATPGHTDEPCADFCVPDCFCCSRSLVAGSVVCPPVSERLSLVDAFMVGRWTVGVHPAVDHPPLARA